MTATTHTPDAGQARVVRRAITLTTGIIALAAFGFSFRNVWALGLALKVDYWAAPLVGPVVDLSVVGLLVALRFLAVAGAPEDDLKGARRLMRLCGALTLALNTAGAVAAGAYGRAAFDAVSPVLLIAWAEVGPTLLRAVHGVTAALEPAPVADPMPAPAPVYMEQVDESAPSTEQANPDRTPAAPAPSVPVDLLRRARRIDDKSIRESGRPASLRALRAELHVGQDRARAVREALTAA